MYFVMKDPNENQRFLVHDNKEMAQDELIDLKRRYPKKEFVLFEATETAEIREGVVFVKDMED